MRICENCFSADILRKTIHACGTIGNCPTCRSSRVMTIETEDIPKVAPDFIEWFSDLIVCFSPASELPEHFPKKKIQLLKFELKKNWQIFSDSVDEDEVYDIVTSICSDLYSYNSKLFDEPIGLLQNDDEDYLQEHSLTMGKTWDDFVDEIKFHNRYHAQTINLKLLEKMLSYLRTTVKRGEVFYRCRLSDDDTLFDANNMGAPPAGKATAGRANAAGISCLYLASDELTTIAEVRAGVFDNMTIAEFRLKQDIPVIDFRSIASLCPVGIGMDYFEYALNKEHLMRIDSEMARGLKRGDHTIDYVATQYIADFIKSITILDASGEKTNAYAGIIYKSTLNPNGYNLAVFDQDLCECVNRKACTVNSLRYETDPNFS